MSVDSAAAAATEQPQQGLSTAAARNLAPPTKRVPPSQESAVPGVLTDPDRP
jgi:hypothetical protein